MNSENIKIPLRSAQEPKHEHEYEADPEMQQLCEKWWQVLESQGVRYLSSKFKQEQVDRLVETHQNFSGHPYRGSDKGHFNKGDFYTYDLNEDESWPRQPGVTSPFPIDSYQLHPADVYASFLFEKPNTVPEGEMVAFSLNLWQKAYDRGHHIPINFVFNLPIQDAQEFIDDINRRPALIFNLFWHRYGCMFEDKGPEMLCSTKMIAIFPQLSFDKADLRFRDRSRRFGDASKKRGLSEEEVLKSSEKYRSELIRHIMNLQNPDFMVLEPLSYTHSPKATSDEIRDARTKIIKTYEPYLDSASENIKSLKDKVFPKNLLWSRFLQRTKKRY